MFWPLFRSILFLLSPETTHSLSKIGIRFLSFILPHPKKIEGNPIGLAAGFDKNCEVLQYLPALGFGHAEIGTVTPKPQGGNEKPRLFRIPKDKNIFNRMGFNNLGAGIVSERLKKVKPLLPPGFIVGVNLGKNKITSEADAPSDYAKVAKAFQGLADYFVINVSSPNTPGLRALQAPEFLLPIVNSVKNALGAEDQTPIYVKLAPELTGEGLKALVQALEVAKISGLVMTNTLGSTYMSDETPLTGGMSGQILSSISLNRLKEARALTKMPIISVGGIMNEEDALMRLRSGAQLIQIYSGWIYGGPFLIKRILKAIRAAHL